MIVKVQEYKGKMGFSIWNDEADEYPIISFQGPKANCILRSIPELVKFCVEHGGDKGKAAAEEFYKQYKPVTQPSQNGSGKKKDKVPNPTS